MRIWLIIVVAAASVALGGAVAWFAARVPSVGPAAGSRTGGELLSVSQRTYRPPPENGYVGSAACAACHNGIAEAFQTHPMSRSTRRIDLCGADISMSGDEIRATGGRRGHAVSVSSDGMWHHERMFDARGELIYDQAVRMQYVVGSGRRAKAYLHRRGDLLLMSPLNWYAESGQWDLAPGYDPDDPRRFDRRITEECLSCHAGRVNTEGRALNRYGTPAFHETAIGCENCHGPGAEHIALHESGLTPGGHGDPIVNPADLDSERREAVCYQCHLQGAARVPRLGRSDFDFRPGQTLDEVWTVLVADNGADESGRTRAVSHVQQMRDSRCYQGSNGRFGCISCHDPHRVPTEAERVSFYRERCLNCHSNSSCSLSEERRLDRDDSCIACHMPKRDANNISHVTQTDHRILRTAAPTAVGAENAPEAVSFFNRADRRLEGWERDRALGVGAWLYLSKSGRRLPGSLIKLLVGVSEKVPEDGTTLTVLGAEALNEGRLDLAKSYYQQAVAVPAAEEAALAGLLKVHYLSAEWEQALDCADRLLEIDPGNASAHAMRADSLRAVGRLAEAIESAEQAVEFNPTLIPVREWLANAYRETGRTQEMQEQERIIRRMHETDAPESF